MKNKIFGGITVLAIVAVAAFKRMGNKIIGGIAIVAFVAIAGFNIKMSNQDNKLSSLNLQNIEALAQDAENNNGQNNNTGYLKLSYNCKTKYGTKTGNVEVTCSNGGSSTECTAQKCPSGESPWY